MVRIHVVLLISIGWHALMMSNNFVVVVVVVAAAAAAVVLFEPRVRTRCSL